MIAQFYDANICTKIRRDHTQRGRQMQVNWVKIVFFNPARSLWLKYLTT